MPSPLSDDDKILRINAVLDRTGLSRSTLYRKVHDGSFPRQISISTRCAGWKESAIRRWIADPYSYRAEAVADGVRA